MQATRFAQAHRFLRRAWARNETTAKVGTDSIQSAPVGGRLFAFVLTALTPGQALQFLLVDLDLAGFFHLLAEIRDEQTKQFLLLILAQRIPDLVLLGSVILIAGNLSLQHREHHSAGVGSQWDH